MTEQTDKKTSDRTTYNFLQSDIHQWRIKADELLNAAYKLETDREPNREEIINRRIRYVYYMLIGFTLECYYKGTIIAKLLKEGNPIKPDELEPSIKNHELEVLALGAGVNVVGKQKKILMYLTQCIKWRGRYPTPSLASAIDSSIEYSRKNDDTYILTTLEPIITIDEIHELIDEAGNQIRRLAF